MKVKEKVLAGLMLVFKPLISKVMVWYGERKRRKIQEEMLQELQSEVELE